MVANKCKECMDGAPYEYCCKVECDEHEFCRHCEAKCKEIVNECPKERDQMAKKPPKITNDKLFMTKIYEALIIATDFQIGSGAIIVNDGLVRIPNTGGDYAVRFEFVRN